MRVAAALALAVALSTEPARPNTHRAVRVDVIAADARGRAVENLKPGDFELTENSLPQTIENVRFIKIDGKTSASEAVLPVRSEFDEQEQAARDGARVFAILLDEYHVSGGATTDRARKTLTRFVDRLGPRDLVAVLKPLDSLLTIRVTSDRDLIRHAIETFEGRKGNYEPRSVFERNYIAGAPARIEQVRAQVATSALSALVAHLGMLNDGRKAVLLVSEGLAGPSRRRGPEALPTLDSVIRSANRCNVSIYAIDPKDRAAPGGEQADAAAAPEFQTLRALADETAGHAVDSDNLDRAIEEMVNESSAYYLLTYRSAHPDDGKFREVRVHVKRPGVSLRARRGYWAFGPDEVLAAEMLAKINAPPAPVSPAFALPWRTSPLIRSWFGISRGVNGTTRVTFVWEPAPRVPGDRTRIAVPTQVVLSAFGSDGGRLFEGTIAPALPDSRLSTAESRIPAHESRIPAHESRIPTPDSRVPSPELLAARAVFDVPPGKLRLRMSIQDSVSQVIDSDVREISVRDLTGAVALGTAEVLRTRNAREFRILNADPQAVPVASREFSRAERLIIRFAAYAPGGAPRVAARLMNRMGQPIRGLVVETPATPDGRFQIDLSLASLAPAEYLIELTASSPAGEAKDLIGFRVTN